MPGTVLNIEDIELNTKGKNSALMGLKFDSMLDCKK